MYLQILHVQQNCAWPAVATGVRGVHFKGTAKPWPSKPSQQVCRFFRYGLPGVRPLGGSDEHTALEATDSLEWNASWKLPLTAQVGACISRRWRLPVYWARRRDGPILTRKCCSSYTMMAARWTELLSARKHHGAVEYHAHAFAG